MILWRGPNLKIIKIIIKDTPPTDPPHPHPHDETQTTGYHELLMDCVHHVLSGISFGTYYIIYAFHI